MSERIRQMLKALEEVDALNVGEAKKLRLRALVKTYFLKNIPYNLADLSTKSRDEIVSLRIQASGKAV